MSLRPLSSILLLSWLFGASQPDDGVLLTSSHREVRSVALSPDGRILAVGTGNEDRGEVELWDLRTRSFVRRLTGFTGPVFALDFSHDGRLLAGSARDTAEILLKKSELSWKGIFWTGYRAEVRLWEVSTGRLVQRIRGQARPDKRSGRINYLPEAYLSIAFSPDDRSLVLFGPEYMFRNKDWHESLGTFAHVDSWDIQSNSVKFLAGDRLGAPVLVSFGPGAGHLMTVTCNYPFSDGLRVWDSKTGAELVKFGGYSGHIYSAAAASGRIVLLSGWPGKIECRVLTSSGTRIRETARFPAGFAEVVALSPDAGKVAVAGAGQVRICRTDTGETLGLGTIAEGFIRALRFSADGSRLVVGSFRAVRILDAATAETELKIDGFEASREEDPGLYQRLGNFDAVAIQPGGEKVACGADDGTIWLADPLMGTWEHIGNHATAITALAFLDELRVAACSSDGILRIWAVDGRTPPVIPAPGSSFKLLASWDDMLACAGENGSIAIWNASTGTFRRSWNTGHAAIGGVAYSKPTRQLLSAGEDGIIRAWEPESGVLLREWADLSSKLVSSVNSRVVSFAVSPDVGFFGLAANNGPAEILDATTGNHIKAKTKETVRCLCFAVDGELLGGNDSGYILQLLGRDRPVYLKTRGDTPRALALCPASRLLVAAGSSYSVSFWDLDTGHLVRVMYAPDKERPGR